MNIKPIPSSNLLSPDFKIEAENEAEKILLRTFIHHRSIDSSLALWIHGSCCAQDNSGVTSFTFGLLRMPDPPESKDPESNPGHQENGIPDMEHIPPPPPAPETPVVVGGGNGITDESNALVLKCIKCKQLFHPRRKDQTCCSVECRREYQRVGAHQVSEEEHKRQQDEKLAQIRKEIPVKREPPKITREL